MERYLGADVHAASVPFCVLDASGKQIRRDVVETNGKALVGYLQQLPGWFIRPTDPNAPRSVPELRDPRGGDTM